MNKKQIAITLGIMCLLLTMLIVVQVRTVNKTNQLVSTSLSSEDGLRDQVLKWKEKYDNEYETLQEAQVTLEKVRQQATQNIDGAEEKEKELKENNMLLGLTDVVGEGVVVTLKDNDSVTADSISSTDDISLYLVHNLDLRSIVNELENAGAEAISINGQRIVSTTSINCEGTVISVNGEKISSPFTINAIGNSLRLYSSLVRPGGFIESLNSTGIPATVKRSNNVEIKKYTGVISSKYMKYAE